MIQVGEKIPAVDVTVAGADGHKKVNTVDLFGGKKVVLFALPGAFTPTCSAAHLPGYVVHADELKAKGVDMIACLSVNDAFVMQAWGQAQNAENLTMIADGGAALTKALGLVLETGDFGGTRSQRYSMLLEDGVVKLLNVEAPNAFEVSKAEVILKAL
ncbi:peroxiredoxin [uncultured Thiothrix sp.]|mgnify:CR=1 FL=1|uniref:peroxiredoxin n=1 Tax=uncultured Thiothrix sp. TaxID=223185 RepID=UPI0026247941|nr:peroxiredoxin [uncultured Thiothrix sp.]